MRELIESFDGLGALERERRELCERSAAAAVFQRPEWLLPWWKHLGSGEICSLAAREGGRLRGVAPGTVLTSHAITDAITRGVRKWDLLRGKSSTSTSGAR